MKDDLKKWCILAMLFLVCFMVYPNGKGSELVPPKPQRLNGPPIDPGLPIDGGLSFLIIAGAAYGIYELKEK